MERLSVSDAARRLGVTPDAVRQRIRRGTIEYEQTEDGRYYVYLTLDDKQQDTIQDSVQEGYINALKSQIEFLQRELMAREEETKHLHHLLAAALERIPAIEPPAEEPPDARESPVIASEDEGKGDVPRESEKAELRPWWRRLLSG